MAKQKAKIVQPGQIETVKLKQLADGWQKTQEEIAELSDDLGEQVRAAIENYGLNRRAFRAAMAELKMEAEPLAAFYEAQDFYREVLGLRQRAESVPKFDVIDGGKD